MLVIQCIILFVHLLCSFGGVCSVRVGAAALTASPGILPKTGSPLTITWSNIPFPSSDDLVLMYSPTELIGDNVIGQFPANGFPGGSIVFPMVNIRASVIFQYQSNGTAVATSNTVTFANLKEPTQGHLAYTLIPTEIRVMWTSASNNIPTVQYGENLTSLQTAVGSSTTYHVTDLCTAPANTMKNGAFREPGWLHDVLLTGLSLGKKYMYRFGDEDAGWSDYYEFVSSPGVAPDVSLNFIMFGDMGVKTPFDLTEYWNVMGVDQQDMAAKSLKWIQRYVDQNKDSPKLILDIGDISYARGHAARWDWYMDSIAPIATQAPWMVSIGNHEFDYTGQPWKPTWSDYGTDSGGECGIPYSFRFNMPGPTFGKLRNLWYSFDVGPVHFLMISAEHNFLVGSPQWNWISDDLSKVNRSITPWIILMGHRPFRCSSSGSVANGIAAHLRSDVEPLLFKYKVDLVLTGHVHKYERTCGFIDPNSFECGQSDEDGIVHILVGTAGNVYQVNWDFSSGSGHHHQPDWSMFRTSEWGISEMRVNQTNLHFIYYGNQRGDVHDELILSKKSY